MSLIGNYNVLQKTPGRYIGGSSAAFATGVGPTTGVQPSAFGLYSDWQKFALSDRGAQTATIFKVASVPYGYYPPSSWRLPISAGGISSFKTAAGSGAITNSNLASGQYIAAPLSGSGDITGINLAVPGNLSSTQTGSGNITAASLSGSLYATATITGVGSVTATPAGSLSASASLSGGGDITAASLTNATLLLTASLSGSGAISVASLTNATLLLTAALSGSGSVSAVPTAPGSISAAIKSYGDLTPQGLSDAVWQAMLANYTASGSAGSQLAAAGAAGDPWASLIETNYTAKQLFRLMSAVLMGKVSGASGNTITFRDVNDTVSRVVATTDSSGDRITVTLSP